MSDEPLWTVRATARFLAISETTLRAWQRAHRVPFLKIGGTIRFVPGEIRSWAADQAAEAGGDRQRQPNGRSLRSGRPSGTCPTVNGTGLISFGE